MADGLGYLVPGVDFKSQLVNMLGLTLGVSASGLEAQLSPLQRQSAAGYKGIMARLSRDQDQRLLGPLSKLVNALVGPFRYIRVNHTQFQKGFGEGHRQAKMQRCSRNLLRQGQIC